MKILGQYRQGDVFIELIGIIPRQAQKQPKSERVILAHGEMTGHHHVLEMEDPADWWKLGEISTANEKPTTLAGEMFLSLKKSALVTHPEHAAIELPPGNYRVTRQREYALEAPRPVRD